MSVIRTTIDEEVVERLPPEARAMYLAFRDLYTRTGGEVEVFVEGFEGDRDDGELVVRASNVHGHARITVDEHGRLADFEWDSEEIRERDAAVERAEDAEACATHNKKCSDLQAERADTAETRIANLESELDWATEFDE